MLSDATRGYNLGQGFFAGCEKYRPELLQNIMAIPDKRYLLTSTPLFRRYISTKSGPLVTFEICPLFCAYLTGAHVHVQLFNMERWMLCARDYDVVIEMHARTDDGD